ncbi:FtsK/SpoIIIE domain-containing protein [Pseudonocardia halophobica]|uniref:Cell division protein FtsK n=1 Tax=Pseudonocardia halophobica TaxID=29401 RepID=A0A9W6NYC9_9PSEU|nr:hypothetical protein [Pseudonocardia halophobica]GLL13362.1 cell division protein FtsK [Pseudonocardia halophobica]
MSAEIHEGELVPVDPPEQPRTIYATAIAVRETQKRPIVPAYLRNRDEARQLGGWLAKYGAHVALYHLTRLPKYAGKLAARAPYGVLVALLAVGAWVFDREATALRSQAVARGSVDEYMKLSKQRNQRVRQRGTVALAGLVALVALTVVVAFLPNWVQAVYVTAAVVVFGKLGTPADRRVTDVTTVTAAAPPRLTAEVVTRALQSMGIAAMNAKGASISYVAPITRDGPGWRADIDLPFGVTVADVAERRDRLASGLRRPLSAVWPEPSLEEHAGRLVLWVGDQPLNQVKPKAWPLEKSGSVELLGGTFPFGTDQRQRPVMVSLAETNALVGSLPGGGKTAAVRVLALAAALDPYAELRIHEHKGSGDLEALARCSHRYVSGVSDAHIAETLDSMREVYAELEKRAATLQKLPKSVVPDNKVTPELARTNRALRPLVLVVDEAQEVFSHGEYGEEAGKLAEGIIKRGRALAVIALFATQRPDAKSLPTGVSTNVGVRFCLRVMDQLANDMVLGTSMYRNGVRATTFTPRDRGIGYLVGVGDEPAVVRTYYVDTVAAEKVAARARAARERAGTVTGYALGEEAPKTAAASLLDDLAVVFATIEVEKVWREDVCAALAERWPDRYGQLTPDALTAALRPLGITTGQVWGRLPDGAGANRRGITREDVQAALDRHRREITSSAGAR